MRSAASAPGKVILLGEHFVVYGSGAVLCAIGRRATVYAEEAPGGRIRVSSELGELDEEPGLAPSDVGRALRPLYRIADSAVRGRRLPGIRITVESGIPPGAGLGSSSACCVACAAAVAGLSGPVDRGAALAAAAEAERTAFPGASGADCAASALGGVVSFSGGRAAAVPGPDMELVVASSGEPHDTGAVVARVGEARGADPGAFGRMLGAVSGMVSRAPGVIGRGDWAGLGGMMNENQGYLEAVGVSTPALRGIVRAGQGAAHGAKITGAGGGGCVVALGGGALGAFRAAGAECFGAPVDRAGLMVFN